MKSNGLANLKKKNRTVRKLLQ